jgi:hypothetical protein
MDDVSVRAVHGGSGALADRLLSEGYDVVARHGNTVHGLGGMATIPRRDRLGAPGLTYPATL